MNNLSTILYSNSFLGFAFITRDFIFRCSKLMLYKLSRHMKSLLSRVFKHKTKSWVLFIVFILFFLILRWNSFTAPFERDEGVYAYSAFLMDRGMNPYQYSFPYKPPMIIYTYYFAQVLFGHNVWGIRLLACLFSLITILFTWLIAKKDFGHFSAWLSAFLLSIMLILPVNFGNGFLADVYYAANTEIFMLLPMVVVLFLYVYYQDRAGWNIWFFSAVMSGIAINYKPICVIPIIYIYLIWIAKTLKSRQKIGSIILKLSLALFSGLITFILIYLPVSISDGGKAVTSQLLGFTGCYKNMGNWNYGIDQFFSRLTLMAKYYWPIYLLAIYFLLKRPLLWKYYIGFFIICYLSVYQSIIGHYYLLIMPSLALVASASAKYLFEEKFLAKVNKSILVLFLLILLIYPIRKIFTLTPVELGLWVYGYYDQFYEAEFVGKKVQEITKPGDFVFIEGSDPEILYFSQRLHATKMEWTNFFTSDCPFLDKYKREYIEDLSKNTPKVIVVCINGSCGGLWKEEKASQFTNHLKKLLSDDYVAVGGFIPNTKGGYWTDSITDDEITKVRTVVFLKR